jgi:hypothetical protein
MFNDFTRDKGMITYLAEAIWNLTGSAEYNTSPQEDGTYTIEWLDEKTQPTKDEIDAEITRLQTEFDAQLYARNRSTEYPALAEQLDEIYHNGIASWKAVIKVTKDKYPKG